ncbi:LD-transpeptidase YbiS [Salmonella bongori]|nr:LD-transpeptidase YbiS [Salmonella bongori]
MGLSNMLEANPGVDTFLPKGGTVLNIPQTVDPAGYRTRRYYYQ